MENETKGALNSGTIRNIAYMLILNLVTKIVTSEVQIQQWLIDAAPVYLDPFIPPVVTALIALLNIAFSVQAVKGRVDVGDIQGMYTKK